MLAALADDIARQAGWFFALRFSGYTKRQIKREAISYLVPLIIGVVSAAWGAVLFHDQRQIGAGLLLGIAVSSFPLYAIVQRFIAIRSQYRKLEQEGKLFEDFRRSPTNYTMYELHRDRTLWGLMVGAIATPFLCALIFVLLRGLPIDGWTLAFCGVLDVIFAVLYRQTMRALDRVHFVTTVISRMRKIG